MAIPSTPSNLFLATQILPADITLIVLEELHKIQRISDLRVVSKQFDALIVPLSYRHKHLTDRILAPFAFKQELHDPSVVQLQVAHDVRLHTRHLTVNRKLDWSLVAKLIRSLRNLRSFTWAFWGPGATSLHRSANSTIGPALCETWPKVQLQFEGLCTSKYRSRDYPDFPNSNLITCEVAPRDRSKLPMIKDLLFERPMLQKLHLVHESFKTSSNYRPKIEVQQDQNVKRLPALRSLIIDGDGCNPSLWEGTNLWNWSQITHLELREVKVDKFLDRVPPQHLSGLKTFIDTARTGCPQLMEIQVDMAWPSNSDTFSTSAGATSQTATTSAPTIMTPSMPSVSNAKRDATGTDRDDTKLGVMGESVIKDLAQADNELETWERHYSREEVTALRNQVHANPASALAGFRNLRRLTIFTVINHFVAPESNQRTFARTRAAVKNWLTELLLTKEGAGFEKVVIRVRSEVVNEELYVMSEKLISEWLVSTYVYAGKRSPDGDAEIREEINRFRRKGAE
ncbi:MAG: hypothetical protein Q9161_002834 [Pseudevernia consocians]